MGKEFENPFELKVVLQTDGGLHIEQVSAHYGLKCEYGRLGRKGFGIDDLTQQEKDAILGFVGTSIKPRVEAHEEM